MKLASTVTWLTAVGTATAQASCPTLVTGNVPAPSVAPGYESRLIATGLTRPRGIRFDRAGHLLVVDRGVGVKVLTLQDDGGSCVTVRGTKVLIANSDLNHGVELFRNESIILASDANSVYAWRYNPDTASLTSQRATIITGMDNPDHSTRTITASKKKADTVIINRGSAENVDDLALNKSTGHAQIKAFTFPNQNLFKLQRPRDFTADGLLLGWGVRNDVGIAEHPVSGGVFTVENSVDNIERYETQFNQQNPGEKLQYMGTLVNNKSPNQGSNFGYPQCFAAWNPSQVPQGNGIQVGQQFSIDPDNISDEQCRTERTAPTLVFDAHMAPLDIVFGAAGRAAFISFHGSFNRPVPQGYKVSRVDFNAYGQPTKPSTSKTAAIDLVKNANPGACPTNCFRPVGLAFDKTGRLFFTSDATGEIYVLRSTAA